MSRNGRCIAAVAVLLTALAGVSACSKPAKATSKAQTIIDKTIAREESHSVADPIDIGDEDSIVNMDFDIHVSSDGGEKFGVDANMRIESDADSRIAKISVSEDAPESEVGPLDADFYIDSSGETVKIYRDANDSWIQSEMTVDEAHNELGAIQPENLRFSDYLTGSKDLTYEESDDTYIVQGKPDSSFWESLPEEEGGDFDIKNSSFTMKVSKSNYQILYFETHINAQAKNKGKKTLMAMSFSLEKDTSTPVSLGVPGEALSAPGGDVFDVDDLY